jgi:hypothetical protein
MHAQTRTADREWAGFLRAALLLLACTCPFAQERALPCGAADKECARTAIRKNPVKQLEFWREALAKPVAERIGAAPPELIELLALNNIAVGFPNKPRSASLAPDFMADVRSAFAELPEVVRRRVAEKLAGIYFVEDLGGTGFTDQAYGADRKAAVGFVVLDPLVLGQRTANRWATWKENTPFRSDPAMALQARIEAGDDDNRKNAIQYILLHELGHVVGVGAAFHPNWNVAPKDVASTSEFEFFELSWAMVRGENRYASRFDEAFPRRRDIVYYLGAKLPGSEMISAYERLEKTDYATLYAATNPWDDFAEAFASYVHTELMKKPFEIRIFRDGSLAKTYGSCWALERCAAKRRLLESFLR